MVVLFMVLRDDTINQTMLVPMDLRNLIPEDHPCYFIKNVVDQIDCSQANRVFADRPGEFAYPRELLLRLILMSVFDGGLSSREIERKTRTDIAYMYLAGMQHPSYRTIARFKVDYPDLIDESFKTTIKIAKEEDLVKIHHVSLDGTKIKAKTSMNKLTKQQLKIMKQHLKESIELDEEEDMELGEESEMVFQKH
ncbi:transposase [Methanobrevibacter smithii]|uniref:transposase n=1 Tax=Methanobrevibacter smithii TaxID=2173 RepID=UPI0037DCA7DE